MKNIVFRVDSSFKIGNGHLSRCANLADEITAAGNKVFFITKMEVGSAHGILKNRYPIYFLKNYSKENDIDDKKSSELYDAKQTIKILKKKNFFSLIVDNYDLGYKWEKTIKPYVNNLIAIDDLANRKHDCDMLLDQNWFEKPYQRYSSLIPQTCSLLLGPSFSLLNANFSRKKRLALKSLENQSPKNLFIFFGGSDPYGLTLTCLMAIFDSKYFMKINIDVVVGSNNKDIVKIENFCKDKTNLRLHKQIDNIYDVMLGADLAIGAAGVNTWERISFGIYTIVISFSENHKEILKKIIDNNLICYLGHYNQVSKKHITKNLEDKLENISSIKNHMKTFFSLVDGKGAFRASEWIAGNLLKNSWSARPATIDDSDILWMWVNDPDVRKNAINKKKIPKKEHDDWFKKILHNKFSIIYIILIDKIPIGQVRFEKKGKFLKIDYSLARHFRGRGIAKKMLNTAIKKLKNKPNLYAEVLNDNIPSKKVFLSLGFQIEKNDDFLIFKKINNNE